MFGAGARSTVPRSGFNITAANLSQSSHALHSALTTHSLRTSTSTTTTAPVSLRFFRVQTQELQDFVSADMYV